MKYNTFILKGTIVFMGLTILAVCAFLLPDLARKTADLNPEYAHLRFPVLFGLYTTVIPFFFALYQAMKLLKAIEGNQVFTQSAIQTLGRIKGSAFIIITIYLLGNIFLFIENALHPGVFLMGAVIMFTSIVIALFVAVLQELLKKATEIKSENDLTV